MLSKFKFSLKDLFVGHLIISPLVLIVISSFHPIERSLEKADEEKRVIVNSLARAAIVYKDKYGAFPSDASAMKSQGIIDWEPENPESYIFKNDGTSLIIYTANQSLAMREYCSGETTNIVYSSKEPRTDLVCGEPTVGEVEFVN